MTLALTPDLRKLLLASQGQPIVLTDVASNVEYVLMPTATFERLKDLMADDVESLPEEFLPLAHQAFAEDWDAPGMDAYDRLPPETQP